MVRVDLPDRIQWRIHLNSEPDRVFEILASDEGRKRFWAEEALEFEGAIRFKFSDGTVFEGKVLEKKRPERFAIEYFGAADSRSRAQDYRRS